MEINMAMEGHKGDKLRSYNPDKKPRTPVRATAKSGLKRNTRRKDCRA